VKEGELEKSRATVEGIAIEYQRLQNNLQKVKTHPSTFMSVI
jgi:hypothetical protein